ncbi:hypothetical protein NKR19_g3525 [Coniochaeta hoffmannii]|uniref:Uncharacterized protein n=1 Tax=Coniochaeta hoffmannii TaxID=91930 RepID=A0AA38S3I7_9PEZI|nr:hypothetical protein NKR19_g3525 [Coniochaeta hoffmannii]
MCIDDGAWAVNAWVHEPTWRCPPRVGAQVRFPVGTSIDFCDAILLEPSIKIDSNYTAFLQVQNGQEWSSSSDISLYPHLESLNHVKFLAMENWDHAETKRITTFNLGLTVNWTRKTLVKQWLLLSRDSEASGHVDIGLNKGAMVQFKTMHSCPEEALVLATITHEKLKGPRYWNSSRPAGF